jgi:hypothetical protein
MAKSVKYFSTPGWVQGLEQALAGETVANYGVLRGRCKSSQLLVAASNVQVEIPDQQQIYS